MELINALGDKIALAVLSIGPLTLYLAYRHYWKRSAPEAAELTRKVLEAQADEEELDQQEDRWRRTDG